MKEEQWEQEEQGAIILALVVWEVALLEAQAKAQQTVGVLQVLALGA